MVIFHSYVNVYQRVPIIHSILIIFINFSIQQFRSVADEPGIIYIYNGWWIGTFFMTFHSVGNVIIPTFPNSIIFQRGRLKPPISNRDYYGLYIMGY